MSTALLLSLAGLALLDSTSIGTLFIPVWLLLSPERIGVGRVLGYLGTIAVCYFAVGLLLVFGGGRLVDALDGAADSPVVLYLQLALGVGLFALSFRFDGKRRRGPGPASRWRDRVTSGGSSVGWLVGLALLAALAEVATMLPYLGAVGLMATADLAAWTVPLLLAGYCLVMVLPAGMLLAGRAAFPTPAERLLRRLNTWIVEKAGNATGWILGIAGFLVARDAAARLWFPHS
ncbi:GAP family protein [Plantactinospora sonchi]|uniref:GAP family protein n=1 Tax=Plantactinospora sonchi TaxID=1544735 RepID=A0ABU7RL85_9ACTN